MIILWLTWFTVVVRFFCFVKVNATDLYLFPHTRSEQHRLLPQYVLLCRCVLFEDNIIFQKQRNCVAIFPFLLHARWSCVLCMWQKALVQEKRGASTTTDKQVDKLRGLLFYVSYIYAARNLDLEKYVALTFQIFYGRTWNFFVGI